MRLVESSNTEVSDASEVSQSHGKLFLGIPVAVFLLKIRSCSSKLVLIEINQNTQVQAITSMNE